MNNHKSSKKKAVQINLSACDKYVFTSKTRRVYIPKERKEASENKQNNRELRMEHYKLPSSENICSLSLMELLNTNYQAKMKSCPI